MAVRGLGLLEPIIDDTGRKCKLNEEEEEYFQSLQGMEEEIQMMAILGRAASLRDRAVDNDEFEESADSNEDGMGQINSMMKCTAMLMFHIVMMASTPSTKDSDHAANKNTRGNDTNATTKAAGYDGRVRHVLKMSCVDGLTHAILQGVERYEIDQATDETSEDDGAQTPAESKLYDVDEYTLWNMANIKIFLDEHNIGKEAIFGTIWNKKSSDIFGLLGKKNGSKQELGLQDHVEDRQQLIENEQPQPDMKDQSSEAEQQQTKTEEFPSIEEMHSDLLLTDEIDEQVDVSAADSISDNAAVAQSPDYEINERLDNVLAGQSEPVENVKDEGDKLIKLSVEENTEEEQSIACENDTAELQPQTSIQSSQPHENKNDTTEIPQEQEFMLMQDELEAQLAKRQLNAKFLASRKFELIERIIAIDVVRFLMAEERERKLRDKEQKEQKNKFMNVVEMIKKATEDDSEKCVDDSAEGDVRSEEAKDPNQNADDVSSENSAEYWTSHRKKQVLRSLKIAGVGLT